MIHQFISSIDGCVSVSHIEKAPEHGESKRRNGDWHASPAHLERTTLNFAVWYIEAFVQHDSRRKNEGRVVRGHYEGEECAEADGRADVYEGEEEVNYDESLAYVIGCINTNGIECQYVQQMNEVTNLPVKDDIAPMRPTKNATPVVLHPPSFRKAVKTSRPN